MKYLDDVRILTDKYEKDGVKKGAIGVIIMSEIRAETLRLFSVIKTVTTMR